MVLPVADYYKGGLKPVPAIVVDGYDRAAPQGVGAAKVAGNYAADLLPNMAAKKAGFPIALYLDAKTNTLVEEFSTSNFLAIDKISGAYVTPKSDAILASITNKSLMELATDEGIEVQRRQVTIDEVMNGKFSEIAACGTAVVVTPVSKVLLGILLSLPPYLVISQQHNCLLLGLHPHLEVQHGHNRPLQWRGRALDPPCNSQLQVKP